MEPKSPTLDRRALRYARPGLSNPRRSLVLATLIAAGETVFILPFVVARIFRPTLLDVFHLSNLQLGTAFSLYGVVAMGAYLAGGPLADRFSARKLMAAALVATALGGAVYARAPGPRVLGALFAWWGLTTIYLFWAALIRATRDWGGPAGQGRAFGLLDGGRGLFAAMLASVMVAVFAWLLPGEPAAATLAERTVALTRVIWLFTGLTVAVAALVWWVVPDGPKGDDAAPAGGGTLWSGLGRVARMPSIWLQAGIVVCAYVGYKATDDFSLLARDTFGYDDVAAARIGTLSFWVRPFAAVGAGLLGDWLGLSRVTLLSFGLLVAGSLAIAVGVLQAGLPAVLVVTVVATSTAIYAVRGVYFALFREARVPLAVTGSAVGLVSILGYTPDVFMGPLMGFLLDGAPGPLGHRHLFAAVAGFAAVGLGLTWWFRGSARRSRAPAVL
jgi:MFS transporter, GlpU family, inner membrane protein